LHISSQPTSTIVNQRNLITSSFIRYAKVIGLDVEQFKTDLKDNALIKKVEDDFESRLRSGVNGTPGFFINGEKYNGNWDQDTLATHMKYKVNFVVR
jgi:predicted DsbA family dithiol-disulfide isomerase